MEKPLPHAFVRPAPEAGMNRRPLAECLRQVAPMRRIAGHPQDRIHKQPVINPAPARRSLPPRQIPRNPLPLRVRQHPSAQRSEEHTSELQSLMRISYAVFCLKKKKQHKIMTKLTQHIHSNKYETD